MPMQTKKRIAICYDFDKTLSPDDMQTFTLIPSFGIDSEEFWHEANLLAIDKSMDKNLAWMFNLIKYSKFKGRSLHHSHFKEAGADVKLYEGVLGWFERLNSYARIRGIELEHYIISSGLREIIEGNPVAPYFKKIYASSYLYSADGIAEWPAQVVNYTTKTQYIYRISKGIFDESDERVNAVVPRSERYIPYENIVYIGDSATDIPCMKLVSSENGHSIGVYDPQLQNTAQVEQLLREGRINYYAPADYREDTPLDLYLKSVIDEIASRESTTSLQNRLK